MTTSSYLAAFGLRAAPLSKEIDDADLWLPTSKVSLLDDIEDAIAERQSILLIGEPGVGKTCVLHALRKRLPEAGYRLTYCRNVNLGKRDFCRLLCSSLGLTPSSTAANLFLAVEAYVGDLRRDKVHPVFLLDEAHLLQPDLLAHLHILLNYDWDASAPLSLVLIGLPELESHLARRTNRSLLTRIHHRFLIDAASVDDTAEYARYHLGAAGAAHTLFPDNAVAELHACSQGSLREIDRIATMSLRDAARRKKKLVDKELVVRAAQVLVRDEQAAAGSGIVASAQSTPTTMPACVGATSAPVMMPITLRAEAAQHDGHHALYGEYADRDGHRGWSLRVPRRWPSQSRVARPSSSRIV